MPYALFNERNQEKLNHPNIGLWYANELKEAEEMLHACREYMTAMNLPEEFQQQICIIDADTGEKVGSDSTRA